MNMFALILYSTIPYLVTGSGSQVFDASNQRPESAKWCNKVGDCKAGEHVVCRFGLSTTKMGPRCGGAGGIPFQMTTKHNEYMVNLINAVRRNLTFWNKNIKNSGLPQAYAMNKLSWNKTLANFAQIWTNQCNFHLHTCTATDKFPYATQLTVAVRFKYPNWENGERVSSTPFTEDGKRRYAVERFVEKMYQEKVNLTKKEIDFPNNKVRNNNYFIMVNGYTTQVGCAMSLYLDYYRQVRTDIQIFYVVLVACIFSSRPDTKKGVYKTADASHPETSPCGCPADYLEEDCLCTKKLQAKGDKGKGGEVKGNKGNDDGGKGDKGKDSNNKGDKGHHDLEKGDKGKGNYNKGDKGKDDGGKRDKEGDIGKDDGHKGNKGKDNNKGDEEDDDRGKGEKGKDYGGKGDKGKGNNDKRDKGDNNRGKGEKGKDNNNKDDKGDDDGGKGDKGKVNNDKGDKGNDDGRKGDKGKGNNDKGEKGNDNGGKGDNEKGYNDKGDKGNDDGRKGDKGKGNNDKGEKGNDNGGKGDNEKGYNDKGDKGNEDGGKSAEKKSGEDKGSDKKGDDYNEDESGTCAAGKGKCKSPVVVMPIIAVENANSDELQQYEVSELKEVEDALSSSCTHGISKDQQRLIRKRYKDRVQTVKNQYLSKTTMVDPETTFSGDALQENTFPMPYLEPKTLRNDETTIPTYTTKVRPNINMKPRKDFSNLEDKNNEGPESPKYRHFNDIGLAKLYGTSIGDRRTTNYNYAANRKSSIIPKLPYGVPGFGYNNAPYINNVKHEHDRISTDLYNLEEKSEDLEFNDNIRTRNADRVTRKYNDYIIPTKDYVDYSKAIDNHAENPHTGYYGEIIPNRITRPVTRYQSAPHTNSFDYYRDNARPRSVLMNLANEETSHNHGNEYSRSNTRVHEDKNELRSYLTGMKRIRPFKPLNSGFGDSREYRLRLRTNSEEPAEQHYFVPDRANIRSG